MRSLDKISRRAFIKAAVTSGLVVGSGAIFSACGELQRTASNSLHELEKKITEDLNVKYLRQIITSDSANSRCIMWQTDSPMTSPTLEIRQKNSAETIKISAEDSSFADDGEKNIQYTVQIKNLSPATEYEYRIIDGEHSTNFYELKTSSDKKFKAIIFPDSQSADYGVWGSVAKSAFEKNPDAEFFVNVGDIVDNGEDRSQWQAWMNQVDEPLKKIPFAPVMGNHETYSREWKVRQPTAYLNYFAVPDNGTENFSRRFYSFDFGAAHFVVLDSQWAELEEFTPGIISAQKNWLAEDIAKTSKTWKIAFIHKDVLQYRISGRPDRREGFSDIGTEFMPVFESLNFDAVFTAHLHTYRNRGRLKNFRSDESGPLYILTGVSGDVRYPGLWINHALDKVTAPQPETDNYLTLEVDEKILLVKCFLPDGSQIDEYSIQKNL